MSSWERLLRPPLRGVGAYEPGPSLDELMTRHGLTRVDKLNWNEGLWGPLPGVEAAVTAALDQIWAYPEHAYNALREAIAAETGARPEQILPAHGIQALILTLVSAFVGAGRDGRRARAHVRPLRPGVARGGRAWSSTSPRRSCGSTSSASPRPCGAPERGWPGSAIPTTPPARAWSRASGARSSTRSVPTAS